MLEDFDRAGEGSFGIGVDYSFKRWNLPAFSLIFKYTRGKGAQSESVSNLPSQDEINLSLDYKPVKRFEGLWIRLRYAETERDGVKRRDVRGILNFPVNIY